MISLGEACLERALTGSPDVKPATSPHISRLDYLDSIRALAAIGVAYLHGTLEFLSLARGIEAKILYFFAFVLDPGKIGVVVFFMVSGFIIPNSLKYNKPRKVALRDFLIGRLFRLYPAYWLSILMVFLVWYHGSFALCPPKRVFQNATMLQGFFADQTVNLIGIYWTLQIEWAFYILCIVLLAAKWLNKPKRILTTYFGFLLLSFAMAIVRYQTHRPLPLAASLGLCAMLVATLWRMVVLDHRADAARNMRIAMGTFVAAIPCISLLGYNFNLGRGENWYRYTLCYWVAIALFVLLTTRAKITWKPLVIVGRASFSLYLFNELFHYFFERVLPPHRFAMFSPNLYIVLSTTVACVLSIPIYQFAEKPFIKLGKKLVRKLEWPGPNAVDKTGTQFV